MAMSSSLLMSRRFAPLFWCQFFSAFSDNFLKNALVFLITFHATASSDSLTQLAVAGFIMHSLPVLFIALLGFGVIGSLFGPIKYGILPDLLPTSRLPAANAL